MNTPAAQHHHVRPLYRGRALGTAFDYAGIGKRFAAPAPARTWVQPVLGIAIALVLLFGEAIVGAVVR